MQPLSLSTCWNSHRHKDGQAMLEEIASLGFESAELSHGISMGLMEGVRKAVQEGVIKISSLHNFCPLPPGAHGSAPNFYEPTATDSLQARLWQEFTRRTIDFAAELKAQAVVLHLGSVKFFFDDPTEKLEAYASKRSLEELSHDPSYLNRLGDLFEDLREKAMQVKSILYGNLEQVIPHALANGIKLGFENREGLRELPLDESFTELLNDFDNEEVVGYWHDSGHAELKSQMGVLDVSAHLKANGKKLIGCHLHDVVNGKDHSVPGQGTVNFEELATYFKADTLRILELSPRLTCEEVLFAKEYTRLI